MRKYAFFIVALAAVAFASFAFAGASKSHQNVKTTSSKITNRLCVYVDHRAGQTYGDLSTIAKFTARTCIIGKKGARGLTGARGAVGAAGVAGTDGMSGTPGARGATGPQGVQGDIGPQGPSIGTFGPVSLAAQDHGCVTDDPGDPNDPWANTTENRSYVVDAMQDGSGYIVTRYDLDGIFTTIPDSQHPGCEDDSSFETETTGTWNGVWSQSISGEFDYNPDAAIPASATWDDFIAAVFGDDGDLSPTVSFVSYEFDYYSECGDHWRDSQYVGGTNAQTGTIGDC
jgi:hypothetical protein